MPEYIAEMKLRTSENGGNGDQLVDAVEKKYGSLEDGDILESSIKRHSVESNRQESISETLSFSPLFVSQRSTSTPPTVTYEALNTDLVVGISVIVPPVQRRWEYRIFQDEGSKTKKTLTRHFRQGRFSKQSSTPRSRSRSSRISNMVSTRQAQATRRRDGGFVDITEVDLSSEDDLVSSLSHPPKKRRLLSGPKPTQPSHKSSSGRLSRSISMSSESSGSAARRRPTRSQAIRTTRSTANARLSYADFPESDEYDVDESEEEPAAEATRRSGRKRRKVGSLREIGEDDIPEATSTTGSTKAIGAKEIFKDLHKANEFSLRHSQICDTCDGYGNSSDKGRLVNCQGCTVSYHQKCLGPRNAREHLVTKVGDENFVLQCRRCIGCARKKESTAPRQGECQVCREVGLSCQPFRERKTPKQEEKDRESNDGIDPIAEVSSNLINNINNVLFRCTACYRAFHMNHLPSRESVETSNDEDMAARRFTEYCRDWYCNDCVQAPAAVGSLVAWRPIDEESYIPGYSTEMIDEDQKEYLIRWKQMSYFRTSWMPGAWVWGITTPPMRKAFARRNKGTNLPRMQTEDAIPEEFLRVDIVLDVKYTNVVNLHTEKVDLARIKEVQTALVKFKGLGYEDVVWEEPPEPEDAERWADFRMAYDDWVHGKYVHMPSQHNLQLHVKRIRSQKFVELKAQPDTLTGGKLMDYQREGLNWLYCQWHRLQNAILADEMGLGKTIQVIGILTTLKQVHNCWPFLIVVPNSTCANWRREIKQWAPSLRVVTYFGSSEARRLSQKYELFPGNAKDLRCHVVVTSYDAAQDDTFHKVFRDIAWAGLIVDEGQRLKNDKNILYTALSTLQAPFKVLLTGTPLQNNPRELFNLLQFLDTSVDAQALEIEYATLTKENVPQLHELLRPFFLRRTKAQVLTFLPAMAQIIVPVTLSLVQKKLYKSILAKNPELIKSIFGGDKRSLKQTERHNLNNILMQLRKCLCHPFVYSRAIEERSSNAAISHRNLVEASSKLQLLEVLLPKLQDRDHRVLIFSQFLDMLDMVEDFLDGLSLRYQRLDGSVSSMVKQKRIDEFNAPESPLFAFLLSTRAGGVGINLATADTVIILDPDFNPHQDIQALSRAHRIGQKKKVLVFQLMTRETAEEKIMQIGKKKMALDHVLIEQMDASDDAGIDLESILRHGAEALFEDNNTHDIVYDSASVDKLLDRSQVENTQTGNDNSAESQFSFARVWANENGTLEHGLEDSSDGDKHVDPTIWEKILKEREREAAEDAASRTEILGRGKRKRQAVDYAKQDVHLDSPVKAAKSAEYVVESDSDTDFQARGSDGDETVEEDGEQEPVSPKELEDAHSRTSRRILGSQESPKSSQPRPFQRVEIPKPPPHEIKGKRKQKICVACDGIHKTGFCPLKIAGYENCGLCGLAHYGTGRTCPHLSNEIQTQIMLQELKQSSEPKALKELAQVYLRGIKGDLVRRKRQKEAKSLAASSATAADTLVNSGLMANGVVPGVSHPEGRGPERRTRVSVPSRTGEQEPLSTANWEEI